MAHCSSYDGGQCTWGVCLQAPWVRDGWGNARDWVGNARRQGFATTQVPTLGAVVAFRAGNQYSEFGHLGLVTQVFDGRHFEIVEMNYIKAYEYDSRYVTYGSIEAFILPPGVDAGSGVPLGPPAPTRGVAGIELAWAQVQQLWSTEVDSVVNRHAEILSALDTLTQG